MSVTLELPSCENRFVPNKGGTLPLTQGHPTISLCSGNEPGVWLLRSMAYTRKVFGKGWLCILQICKYVRTYVCRTYLHLHFENLHTSVSVHWIETHKPWSFHTPDLVKRLWRTTPAHVRTPMLTQWKRPSLLCSICLIMADSTAVLFRQYLGLGDHSVVTHMRSNTRFIPWTTKLRHQS